MTVPDKDSPTEIELEFEQRERLMEMFSLVETFDKREAVIAFCEDIVRAQRED